MKLVYGKLDFRPVELAKSVPFGELDESADG